MVTPNHTHIGSPLTRILPRIASREFGVNCAIDLAVLAAAHAGDAWGLLNNVTEQSPSPVTP